MEVGEEKKDNNNLSFEVIPQNDLNKSRVTRQYVNTKKI